MEEPYERELYNLFKSECNANGVVDHNGVEALCDTLQLDFNQREHIWSCLDRCPSVSFQQFRDALVYLANNGVKDVNEPRELSPVREISPKYVSGAKKYGRRSKPRDDNYIISPLQSSPNDMKNNCMSFSPRKLEYENGASNLKSNELQEKNRMLSHGDDKNYTLNDRLSMDKHGLSLACEHLEITPSGLISKVQLYDVVQHFGNNEKLFEKINEKYTNDDIPIKEVLEIINNLDFRSISPDSETSTSGVSSTSFYNNGDNSPSSMLVNVNTIVELWDNCCIPEPINLLQDLGIDPSSESMFNLLELISSISAEFRKLHNNITVSTLPSYEIIHSAFVLLKALNSLNEYQNKWLKMIIEQVSCEKDKLKYDVDTANNRAAMLAQEVDENHMRLEKSSTEKIIALEHKHNEERKTLIDQWGLEKDHLFSQNNMLNEKLREIKNYESELQSELATIKKQLSKLEKENSQLNECLEETLEKNAALEIHVQEIPKLKQKELELEANNGQIIDLLEKIDNLKNENKTLRDQNDELVIELEAVKGLHSQDHDRSFESNVRNFLAEENSPNCFGKINMYSTTNDLAEECTDSTNTSETYTVESDSSTWNKDELSSDLEQKCPLTSSTLVNNIKSTLSQSQINSDQLNELINYLELMKQKSQSSDQKKTLPVLQHSPDSVISSSPLAKYPTRRSLIEQFENSSLESTFVDSSPTNTNSEIESLQQLYNKCKMDNQELHKRCEQLTADWEARYSDLGEVADKALDEAKRLKDECTGLENGMDALRNEYYECEEYWSTKLDEERKLNEMEKKMNEEKLNDLEVKIKEYSDMLQAETSDNNKLSTINENSELEEQINCIQTEFMEYQTKTEEELFRLVKENDELKCKIVPLVEKVDREVSVCKLSEECEKCNENFTAYNEFKTKHLSLKKSCHQLNKECHMLVLQRNRLRNEISNLQQYFIKLSNNQPTRQDVYYSNQLSTEARKCKELEQKLHSEQARHQKLTDAIWKEHQLKVDEVHKILRSLQDRLEEQIKLRKDKTKQLMSADMVVKELFIDNAKLMSMVHNLQLQIDHSSTYNSM
ncbi:ninein [Adelges cooleyi]|uniref:ninein n=1 Tax=Adelges cooleyi TaxID=133065 RepID=UPI00217F9003|nr:ninein [Adelges cooleyi]XP_050435974.1 ninein [Adelges cooleyi]